MPFRSVAENIFLGREHRRFGLLDWGRMHSEAGGACSSASPSRSTSKRPLMDYLDRDPADGRHRPRGLVQGPAGHHGRADLLARRARGRGAVRRDAAVARRGRGGDLHHPPARRALSGLRPGDRDARRSHGDDEPHGRRRQAAPRRRHARPRPRDGALACDRLLRRRNSRGPRSAGRRGPARSAGACATRASRCGRARSSASPACSAPAAPRPRAPSSAPIPPTRARSASWASRSRRGSPPTLSRSASAIAARIARPTASFPTCRCART